MFIPGLNDSVLIPLIYLFSGATVIRDFSDHYESAGRNAVLQRITSNRGPYLLLGQRL